MHANQILAKDAARCDVFASDIMIDAPAVAMLVSDELGAARLTLTPPLLT